MKIKIYRNALEEILSNSIGSCIQLDLSPEEVSFGYREAFGYLLGEGQMVTMCLQSEGIKATMEPSKQIKGKVDYHILVPTAEIERINSKYRLVGTYHTHDSNLQPTGDDFEFASYLDRVIGKQSQNLLIGNISRFILDYRDQMYELAKQGIDVPFIFGKISKIISKEGLKLKKKYVQEILRNPGEFIVSYFSDGTILPIDILQAESR